MLAFHVLNVGHGSSIVVEFDEGGDRFFGVIDSNMHPGETPKALSTLKKLGATRLSFVALTHPHKDHFSGLYSVILAFNGAIDNFYSCPFGDLVHNRDRLNKLASGLKKIWKRTDALDARNAALEMAQILMWADRASQAGILDWHECKGESFGIAPNGFSEVDVSTILPPSRVVGDYVQRMSNADMSVIGSFEDNEISLAFKFQYKGKTVILGGDGTKSNWVVRRRYETKRSETLSGHAVNLPHHGSKHDCSADVLAQVFSDAGPRYGLTSANGISHPDFSVIQWQEKNAVKPFCTNLIPACGANSQRLLVLPTLEPELARWLREVAATNVMQVCQGDITVRIDKSGSMTVTPQFNHPCAYRGDYDLLFQQI